MSSNTRGGSTHEVQHLLRVKPPLDETSNLFTRSKYVQNGSTEEELGRSKSGKTRCTTKDLVTTLKDIFVTTRVVAFERCKLICRKQKKTESLE